MAREFIDRERQYGPDVHTTPGDQLRTQSAVDNMQSAPRGEPPKAFDVRAVYDSRPVQGFDFNITASDAVGERTTFVLGFEVPSGYVCVLRRLHHSSTPTPVIVGRSDIQVTLLVNNASVRYNQSIPVGVESDDIVECFVIADEFSQVQAQFDLTADVAAINFTMYAQFYGQFLLKTGIPYQFEVANPTNKVFAAPVITPRPLPNVVRKTAPMVQPVLPQPAPMPAVAKPVVRQPPKMFGQVGNERTPIYDPIKGGIIGWK